MINFEVRFVRVKGDDNPLLLKRRFLGFWQRHAYYNNEVYRSQVKMNKIVAQLEEEYAKHCKLSKKRAQINRSIDSATFEEEDIGFTSVEKLPLFRKDKKPLEKPPSTWLKFVRVLKNGPSEPDECPGTKTTVELADDASASKGYHIQPVKQNNQSRKQRNQQNQQNNNGQNN